MNSPYFLVDPAVQTARLLVVTREPAGLQFLWGLVASHSWRLENAASAWDALERVQSGLAPHLLILDLPRGDGDSLLMLRWLRRLRPDLPTLLLCHAGDVDKQRDAFRLGANEVLVRPFDGELVELAVQRCLNQAKVVPAHETMIEDVERIGEDRFFVTASPITQKLRIQAELLAETDVPVLILGEKGSGKESVARLIHHLSVRSGFRFLKVNCADNAADLLEKELFVPASDAGPLQPAALKLGEKGAILFDQVTEMSHHLQGRLLGALQDLPGSAGKTSRVRILASSHDTVERALAEKKLREDLYYRLSAFTVHVPPLRQRKEEIRALLHHFMHSLAKHYGLPAREFSRPVLESCEQYWWPGNIEELEAFVKRYLVAGDTEFVLKDMETLGHKAGEDGSSPHAFSETQQAGNGAANATSLKALVHDIKSETERNAIGIALEKTGWNRKAAARLLRVSYRTLLYKIEQYQMKSSESFLSPLPLNGAGPKDKVS